MGWSNAGWQSDDGGWYLNKVTAGGGLMLDGITTGIKVAYSTRQLLTAYAGSALQVIRASDSTLQNIGFVGNVLDTASLATFCSGTTGSVNIWYDQSGGGHDLIPGTAAPVIFASGAVTTINSQPAVKFTSASTQFLKNTSLTANPVNTLYQNAVIIVNATAGNNALVGSSGVSSLYMRIAGTSLDLENAGVIQIAGGGTVTAATGAVVETLYNSSTGTFAGWINRTGVFGGTNAQTLSAQTLQLGAWNSGTEKLDGFIGEYIAYDQVGGISGSAQTSIENNQHTYWGTP